MQKLNAKLTPLTPLILIPVNSLPFAVVGADYSTLNAFGEFNLYDPATGQGLTDKYLEDRSGYLVAKLNDNRTDGVISTLQDVRYRDLATGTILNPINAELRRVTFGSVVLPVAAANDTRYETERRVA